MNLALLNFQHASFLWALFLIPIVYLIWSQRKKQIVNNSRLERFADRHLLPYLLKNLGNAKAYAGKNLILWSTLWALGILAIAGPRWDFTEVKTYKPRKDLVVLLDLSTSMNLKDIQPSRLIRAREKIEDLINENPDLSVGLVGFAGDAHIISPITEDRSSIRYLLGAVDTDLIPIQGDRLAPALKIADRLLSAEPDRDRAILIMSDGEFQDGNLNPVVSAISREGIQINAMGFGDFSGGLSKLQNVSAVGKGLYSLPDD
jgi:Ca-activated chloride channel family protein